MSAAPLPGAAPSPTTAPRATRRGLALVVLVAAQALVLIDDMIVTIALPGMSTDLALSPLALSWVLTAYLLTFGGLLLLGGRLGDVFGRRRVFLVGLVLFTVGSLVRGVAPSGGVLVAARVVQGVGAALTAPSVLALVVALYDEGPSRKRAIAVYTGVAGVSAAGGLLIAGLVTELVSWRGVLVLGVPVGVAVLVAAPFVLPGTAPATHGRRRIDLVGAATSALGLAALVGALSSAGAQGWRSPLVVVGLVAAFVLLAVFVVRTRRAAHPLVLPVLFARPARSAAYSVVLVVQGAQIGQLYFLSQFFQQGLGFSPLVAASAFLPVAVTLIAAAGAAAKLEPRVGARTLVVSGALALVASNVLLTLVTTASRYATDVLPALLLLGVGIGLVTVPATAAGTAGLSDEGYGSASSMITAMTSIGASLGIAVLATVMVGASAGTSDPALAFVTGMQAAFLAATGFAAATALLALLLPGRRPGDRAGAVTAGAAAASS